MKQRLEAPACITFDLDDTLWDCATLLRKAEEVGYRFLEEHLPDITNALGPDGLLAHRQAHYRGIAHMRHDLTASRKHWLHAVVKQYGYDRSVVEPAFRAFWEARNAVELFDGARETLDSLKGRYRLGVITNGNADVHYIGIGDCFDFVVTAESAGAAKPDPSIFEAALAAGEARPANTVHVGDDPNRDINGASALGLRTVWVNPALSALAGGAQSRRRYP